MLDKTKRYLILVFSAGAISGVFSWIGLGVLLSRKGGFGGEILILPLIVLIFIAGYGAKEGFGFSGKFVDEKGEKILDATFSSRPYEKDLLEMIAILSSRYEKEVFYKVK